MRFRFVSAAALAAAFLITAPVAQARVNVTIDLTSQRMHVTSPGGSYTWKVSTGVGRYHTPRGTYRPYLLKRMHYSRKYDNAPMPYSIFFRGGYAIHGTNAVGRLGAPASHGCIRLAPGNAAKLFSLVKRQGASISIVGSRDAYYAKYGKKSPKKFAKKKSGKTYAASKRGGKKFLASATAKKKYAASKRYKQGRYAATTKRNSAPMAYAPRRQPTGVFNFFRNPNNPWNN